MYILKADVANAVNIGRGNVNLWFILFAWLTYPIVLFVLEFLIIKKVPALTKDGRIFAVVMLVLVAFVTWGLVRFFTAMLTVNDQSWASNKIVFDWHWWRLRPGDAFERVGHHLAQQQTDHRRHGRHRSRRAPGTRASGVYRVSNERVAVVAHAAIYGDVARRLGHLW
jgi:hypothetical protein